jgi:hypothetical protein
MSDPRTDGLYLEHPAGFVAGRNRLVKDLRAAGERDEAERIRKLRRPTVAAWLINGAALSSPEVMKRFAEASRELEEAQRRALEGEAEGTAEWRAAAGREREATEAVVEFAASRAREVGHPPSERAVELAAGTLRAASGDPELRGRVLAGRVEREQSAATLGPLAAGAPSTRDRSAARRRERAQADRERDRLEAELADATAREERARERVEQATDALRQAKARLTDEKRDTTRLRRQLATVRRRARNRK